MLGRTPTLTELGVFSRALVGALLVQALEAGAQDASRPPAPQVVQGPGENAGVLRLPRRAGRSRSRSSRTTTRRRSSRTRARRPASAAFCATCSPWARGRSRCSTACGSARSIIRANRYLFAGVVQGSATTATASASRRSAARSSSPPGYTGNPLVNAMCVGLLRGGGPDPRRGARRRQRAALRRRAHRPRRHPRRVLRVRGAVARRARRGGRRSRSAIRSPRSCCSRRASS